MKIANVEVGKPETSPSKPSHVRGVRMGNAPGGMRREPGMRETWTGKVKVNGRRSTGINSKDREPIDERMPRLTPA